MANTTQIQPRFAVIVPCYNEHEGIRQTLAELRRVLADAGPYELIVVDDGSVDGTAEILAEAIQNDPALSVLTHIENRGYGASLKTGLLHATAELIVITDADGTYPNDRIMDLVEMAKDVDMVVGARTAANVTYPLIRKIPKVFLRAYASWVAARHIPDINSGLRVFRRSAAIRFLNVLPNGFSFTTTITLALITNSYSVKYEPIGYSSRLGKSKIRPIHDTLNFVRLIVCTGMYFAPLRVLAPIALVLVGLFLASASYDAVVLQNMTDKTLVLLTLGVNMTLFALMSDMIVKKTGEVPVDSQQGSNPVSTPLVKVAGAMHRSEETPDFGDQYTSRAA
jgi:glycosyltransferase involved in cell wall biosynthesis